ncbi:MAG: hypothetical protein IJU14_06365, partial [Clostridia bacterium]|nr:hypothetical protein [Clostridia bacterium]
TTATLTLTTANATVTATPKSKAIAVQFDPKISTLKSDYASYCNHSNYNENLHKYHYSLENNGFKRVEVHYYGGTGVSDTTATMTYNSTSGLYETTVPANATNIQFKIIINDVDTSGSWSLGSGEYTLWGTATTIGSNRRWKYSALANTHEVPITQFTFVAY